jgi:4'-phosphopantetheinyl transferase EntD
VIRASIDASTAGLDAVVALVMVDRVPAGEAWLSDAERAILAGFTVPKRRSDYRLGRWAARRALFEVTGGEGAFSILADASGAPRVLLGGTPADVAISLSHSGKLGACAAVMTRGAAVELGCDVETIEPRSEAFVTDFFTEAERELIDRAGRDRDVVATLLWSAKESALKATGAGLRADTRSVAITLGEERGDGWTTLVAQYADMNHASRGLSRRLDGAVLTLVARPALGRVRLLLR